MAKILRFHRKPAKGLYIQVNPSTIWGKPRKKASVVQERARKWRGDLTVQLTFHDRNRPMTRAELSKLYNKSEGYLGTIAKRLVIEEQQAIGSGSHGLYWIRTEKDLEEAVDFLVSSAITRLLRASKLARRNIKDIFNDGVRDLYERLQKEDERDSRKRAI